MSKVEGYLVMMEYAVEELDTVLDWLRWMTSCFYSEELYFGHGFTEAWDEALQLLLHCLSLPPDSSNEILSSKLLMPEKQCLAQLIYARVRERRPTAYIISQAWFAGMPYYVDERVLIPRSPTAEFIEKQFEPWVQASYVDNILDLCTGSACIAIACAHYFPEAKVDAVDISRDALDVAKINVGDYDLEDRVELVQSDLFDNLQHRRYDLIVTNPPYVDAEEMASLHPEYKHEPFLALEAGEDGLQLALKILATSSEHLTESGILVMELGDSYRHLQSLFPDIPFTWLTPERGGEGILLMSYAELCEYENVFKKAAK